MGFWSSLERSGDWLATWCYRGALLLIWGAIALVALIVLHACFGGAS